MAALTLQKILFDVNSKEFLKKNWKPILYTIGGVFVLLGLIYMGMDYGSSDDADIMAQTANQTGTDELGRLIVSALKSERKAMFGGQILRALGLVSLGAIILFAYAKNKINALVAGIVLLLISTAEITLTSYKYFNNENDQYAERPDNEKLFVSKEDYNSTNFRPSEIDSHILKDTGNQGNFRVFNLAADTYNESRTSYFHKSIGGYHPAKLRIYQDVIEKYLRRDTNSGILNMLNDKYVIGQNRLTGADTLITRTGAFGPCWLVKNVKVVNSRVDEIKDIGKVNLKDTAVVDSSFGKEVIQPQWDSSASIKMTKFDNDTIEYEVNGKGPQFALFSEIYYPVGWNAYIDGKSTAYVNANYILRAISVPAGKHSIKFVFEPASVKKGRSIMFIASILILLVFLGGLYMAWRQSRMTS
jgi:uncharacterized membrane protein YfhO